MLIGGLQKTTLIDYPGKIACSIFTVGCNFACPFCHNRDLVSRASFLKSKLPPLPEKEVLDFLLKRKKILDGVCITGGEPTIQPGLVNFIRKIKKLGLAVKLDTNGSNPKLLSLLFKKKLLDYVAMDVKLDFSQYQKLTNIKSISIIKSINIILKSGREFEFRTTIVPGLHSKKNLIRLAAQLKSLAEKNEFPLKKFFWYWQNFRPKNCLSREYLKIKPYTLPQLKVFLQAVKKILPSSAIRGDIE